MPYLGSRGRNRRLGCSLGLLRLQVVVEAPRERLAAVLAAQDGVRQRVENGWVQLYLLQPETGRASRWSAGDDRPG